MKNVLNIATALLIVLFFAYQFYTQTCEEKCEENTESKCSSEEKKECKFCSLCLMIFCLNETNFSDSLVSELIFILVLNSFNSFLPCLL